MLCFKLKRISIRATTEKGYVYQRYLGDRSPVMGPRESVGQCQGALRRRPAGWDIPDELCLAQQGSDHGVEFTPVLDRMGVYEYQMVVGESSKRPPAIQPIPQPPIMLRCMIITAMSLYVSQSTPVGHKQRVTTNGLGVEMLGVSTCNSPFHSPHRLLQSDSAPKNISWLCR